MDSEENATRRSHRPVGQVTVPDDGSGILFTTSLFAILHPIPNAIVVGSLGRGDQQPAACLRWGA